jgi:hypothetical protein
MNAFHFIRSSSNRKTGPLPVTYSARSTCPPSCPHIGADCYAEDFLTRMTWDKVAQRGHDIAAHARAIASLPPGQAWRMNVAGDLPGPGETVDAYQLGEIVKANKGRRGFTYTHKHSPDALMWIRHANAWGFTINLSADDAGHADQLAATDAGPVVCIVPSDTPEISYTPEGRQIVICQAQTRDGATCESCGNFQPWCSRADRSFIVGFRAHGSKAKQTDAKARRVIPILKG